MIAIADARDGRRRRKPQQNMEATTKKMEAAVIVDAIVAGNGSLNRHYRQFSRSRRISELNLHRQSRIDASRSQISIWRGGNGKGFNASFMLEKLRGKRMMFVGDSLNRGQFISMVCLLHRSIPEGSKSMKTKGSLTIFTAKDYNATIEFYWAPFLVESNSDDAIVHRVKDRIVRAGSINKHARHWKGSDIMVFNTYLWWMTGQKMRILRGPFDSQTKNITEMVTEDAYRLALRRMLRWVENNLDPHKARVFFTTMSPCHERSAEWGGEEGGNCYGETAPIEEPSYWGLCSSRSIMNVVSSMSREAKKVPVTLLNITQLSDYRKDAHTSIYKKQWSSLTHEQISNPRSYADCVHWCLPGLQDTWNDLLYAKLFFP